MAELRSCVCDDAGKYTKTTCSRVLNAKGMSTQGCTSNAVTGARPRSTVSSTCHTLKATTPLDVRMQIAALRAYAWRGRGADLGVSSGCFWDEVFVHEPEFCDSFR